MRQEDKVTTKELSKRMVELGWKFETERYWCLGAVPHLVCPTSHFNECLGEHIPAPDAIEIGEQLPFGIVSGKTREHYACTLHFGTPLKCGLNNRDLWDISNANTDAESKGLIWCYLKEQDLLRKSKK